MTTMTKGTKKDLARMFANEVKMKEQINPEEVTGTKTVTGK